METYLNPTPDLIRSCDKSAPPSPLESSRSDGSLISKLVELSDNDCNSEPESTSSLGTDWTNVIMVVVNDLHQSRSGFEVTEAFSLLEKCLQKSQSFENLMDEKPHRKILASMQAFISVAEVQEAGCNALLHLIAKVPEVLTALQASTAHMQILRIIQKNLPHQPCQVAGLELLCLLAEAAPIQQQLLYSEIDALNVVVTSMSAYPRSASIQIAACKSLRALLIKQCPFQEDLLEHKEYKLIITALQIHESNAHVTLAALSALDVMLESVDENIHLAEDGVHLHILQCLKRYCFDEAILTVCLGLFAKLMHDDAVCMAFVEEHLVPDLQDYVVKYRHNSKLQENGFSVFHRLAHVWFTKPGVDHEGEQWMKQIFMSMTHHREKLTVQEACCNALSKLLHHLPHLRLLVGENSYTDDIPIHTVCIGILLMHGTRASTYEAVCNALYWLTTENTLIQEQLVMKNIHIAILLGMRTHKTFAGAQIAGCRVLRALSIYCRVNKEKIAWSGTVHDLLRAQVNFLENVAVQVESLATIACLADTAIVQVNCMVDQVYLKILAVMQAYKSSEILQKTALEALIILCAAEKAPEVLNEAHTVERVIETMERHENSVDLQTKALILIQLLAHSQHNLCEGQLARNLAKTIVNSLTIHQRFGKVQAEGCVAMQVLIETSENMSIFLLEYKGHERIFYILHNYEEYPALVALASECLYVFCCVRNLKSQLLVYACSRGLFRAVECLIQLGADVNHGSGPDSPLCQACRLKDENLISYLLEQGAGDTQLALQISLEQKSHTITGILLRHIGYDKEECIATWNGLNLGNLHPKWLIPTLVGNVSERAKTDYSKNLTNKVASIEAKRIKRKMAIGNLPLKDKKGLLLRYPSHKHHNANSTKTHKEIVRELQYLSSAESSESEDPKKQESMNIFKRGLSALKRLGKKKQQSRSTRRIHTSNLNLRRASKHLFESAIETVQSPPETSMTVRFALTRENYLDWKKSTISGANVPFSHLDPRQETGRRWSQENNPFGEIHLDRRRRSSVKGYESSYSGESFTEWSRSHHSLQTISDGSTSSGKEHYVPQPKRPFSSPASEPRLGHRLSVDLSPRGSFDFQLPHIRARSKSKLSFCEVNPDTETHTSKDGLLCPDNRLIRSPSDDELFQVQQQLQRRSSRYGRTSTLGDIAMLPTSHKMVQHIDLASNQINNLSGLVSATALLLLRLKCLEKLELCRNNLHHIPEDLFSSLDGLQHLCLCHNNFTTVPAKAFVCPKLQFLDISHNQIHDFGEMAYHHSTSMKILNIGHNLIRQVPLWLSKSMPKLEELTLISNKIEELPEGMIALSQLKMLDLSFNYVQSIPEAFLLGFPKLEHLKLDGNELHNLPSEEVAKNLHGLHTLQLRHNLLTGKEPFYLPKFVLELTGIRVVDLSHNNLVGLPEPSCWSSTSIRDINVSHNRIKKLKLGHFTKKWAFLTRLNISHNKLQEIPKELGQLTGLSRLDFSHNQITTIPDELGKLEQLYEMPLHGLKLDLDEALIKGRTRDLIGYLHEKLKRSVEYFHIKMMITGFGGRGKSTLLRALMKTKPPEYSPPTVGVVVKEWKFSGYCRNRYVTYTLNAWDFAGQEEFYSTHQCFMSKRALYLVVYNIGAGETEIDTIRPWLVNIQARAPNCPVIVVGTHMDQVPRADKDQVVATMRERIVDLCKAPGFPMIRGMLEVDCSRENSGIERLRVLIKEVLDSFTIKKQPVMGQKIPASYVRLQELLSEESKNCGNNLPIILHSRLVKIVKDAELDLDADELHQAVRFLHESGVILHYEDLTLRLNNLYFINPGWLCRMMAQIITVPQINPFINKYGIMKREDVHVLFPVPRRNSEPTQYTFPHSLIPQYLRLLERFEIVLPQNDDELLIPSRLPDKLDVPVSVPVDEGHGHVIRQYVMEYVPTGFWARLITRLLGFIRGLLSEQCMGISDPEETQYWKQGIYVRYSQEVFFLLRSLEGRHEGLELKVPLCGMGIRVLGHIVDHIDALVDEWYPGLAEITPMGVCVLKKMIPCPICLDTGKEHEFLYDDLVYLAEIDENVDCPIHKGSVPISLLAPDIVLGDLEPHFHLNTDQFVFVASKENLLGDGSYGRVYRARYKNQGVAVKVYNTFDKDEDVGSPLPKGEAIGDVHPSKLMRQEVSILRCLNHPSLISLLAVGLRPRTLVLELAPLGSLGTVLSSNRTISRPLQHRIAMQMIEGLVHLHSHKIVYRDLKPDNVLMVNLSMAALINAKIADYGIARFTSPYGLAASEGTPGYRAPEVVRGEAYAFQADVYSFGITLYELITGGMNAFNDLGFRNELDDAVIRGRPIDPITECGVLPWPDLEELMAHCLQMVPERRPSSIEVYERLQCAELLSLKKVVAVSKNFTVECMAVRLHQNDAEVWLGSGCTDWGQVSWVNMSSPQEEIKGTSFMGSRILCMCPNGQNTVLVGTQSGRIWVFDAVRHQSRFALPPLPDAILYIQHVSSSRGIDYVFAGLANGKLAVFDATQITQDSKLEARYLQIGTATEPIKCLVVHNRLHKMFVSAGVKIHVLTLSPLDLEKCWNTSTTGSIEPPIASMNITTRLLHVTKLGEPYLEQWDCKSCKLRNTFSMKAFLIDNGHLPETSQFETRITAVTVVNNSELWVGTGSGHLVLLDLHYNPLMTVHRYEEAIRCISWVRVYGESSAVLTGGMGFKLQPHNKQDTTYKEYGCLAIWEPDMLQQHRSLVDYVNKRQEWHQDNSICSASLSL